MKTNKKPETIYVIRTTCVPLSSSELEARKNELPLVIAQEDRLALRRKDLLAELKAEAEDLAQKKGQLVQEINTGEKVEDLRCPKTPVLSERMWHVIHPITGEVLERIPMQWGEIEKLSQTTIPEEDETEDAPAQEPIVPEYSPVLALPAPPPVGEDLPLLEGEIVEVSEVEGVATPDLTHEPEAEEMIHRASVAYCYPRDGAWEGGGACEIEDGIPAFFDTLARAREFAREQSDRNRRFLIHVTVETKPKRKGGSVDMRGDLWYFRGQQVSGGVSNSIPSAEDLAAVGCVLGELCVSTTDTTSPSLFEDTPRSALETADDFAQRLV